MQLIKSRVELETTTLQEIRDILFKRGDLKSYTLFLPRKVELCFVGCKLLDALQEYFPNLRPSQVGDLADFLFEKRFLFPVVKFMTRFRGTTVLYRLSMDERRVQQSLDLERARTKKLAREILRTFEIVPSSLAGRSLQDIVSGIVERDLLVRFGGLTTKVQLQLLLLHGFVIPDMVGNEELYQLFRCDCYYSFSHIFENKGDIRDIETVEPDLPTTPSCLNIKFAQGPELVESQENSGSSKSRRLSRISSFTGKTSKKTDGSELTEMESKNRLSPRGTKAVNYSKSDRRPTGRPNPTRKRSSTLQDFAVVIIDEIGNAHFEDPGDIKPLEFDLTPLPENFEILDMVDSGKFGNVYRCKEKSSGAIMAVKQINFDPRSRKKVETLENELDILKTVQHGHIVRYYGSFSDHARGTLNIFMEFVEGSSMRRYIQRTGPLSNEETIESLAQILLGLSYLHSNFIIHRDLKGANVLRSANGVLKIADFGCSKKFTEENEEQKAFSTVGTPYWMCPEIIRGEGHNNKCDVWALGATCYEFLTGKPPYFDLEPVLAIYKIGSQQMKDNLTFDEGICDELRKLMWRCFETNPTLRPSVDEILTLPVFSQFVSRRRCVFYT
ncbi:hypothetical protein ACHWQZ_G002010 [Mnemiopsis leidyi]